MILHILHWSSRLILAGVFLFSGYVKVQSPLQFAANLTTYQLFPADIIQPIVQYLPWIEIALGLFLLTGWKLRYFAAAAAALLSMFTCVLLITYFRGIEADCGCFGPGDRISPLTITRDALFMLPAVFLVAEAKIRMQWSGWIRPAHRPKPATRRQ
jgi:uncharacterized membrane protein YphA (DoxX/SURF4 family)